MSLRLESHDPPKRSAGSIKGRRVPSPWPHDREFRILSIDGGGVRGLFPAALLKYMEEHFLSEQLIGHHFDLITGTSTGGIIAVALGAGVFASRINTMYTERSCEIFPPWRRSLVMRCLRYFRYSYDNDALVDILQEIFGTKTFGESVTRLCIPAFEGKYGEPYIFKTPHHPDFQLDRSELMSKVATCTSVAPTFFRPHEDAGYVFVDGGVWANNPIMVGLVDALSCFDVSRNQIRILSLGCGGTSFHVGTSRIFLGGILSWRSVIDAAISLQSHNALGQARLLIGADRVLRVSPPPEVGRIDLDDCRQAVALIPETIDPIIDEYGERIYTQFFSDKGA